MARVKEQFYDATTQTQYHVGDVYDGPDEKKEVLREKGMIGERLTDEPEGERYSEYDYEENYSDAQALAGELDVDIALNSSHEELVEAINAELG